MSVVEATEFSPAAGQLDGDISSAPATCHTVRLTTSLLPTVIVITAEGEIDASNAEELADYVLRHAPHRRRLILDLTGLDFFAIEGFSVLHRVNVGCAGAAIQWAVVPSAPVSRVLRICDPAHVLPFVDTVNAALSTLGRSPRLLQLVTPVS